jgi:hypothetical protein
MGKAKTKRKKSIFKFVLEVTKERHIDYAVCANASMWEFKKTEPIKHSDQDPSP